MSWSYDLTNRANRDLRDVDEDNRRRVFEVLDRLTTDPARSGVDIQRVKGTREDWRLRVGRWRVLFRYDRQRRTILVTRILPRNEGTYRG